MNTIVLITGGVDSTYTLWKILTTTDENVTAVFFNSEFYNGDLSRTSPHYDVTIKMKNFIPPIIKWLNDNVRSFTFKKVNMNLSSYGNINCFSEYATRYAVEYINNGTYDKFVLSYEKENDGAAVRSGPNAAMYNSESLFALEWFKLNATRGEISFPLLDVEYNHSYAISELPKELFDMTYSCTVIDWDRDLKKYVECGECFKCEKKKFFCEQLDLNKSPKQIQDYVNSKSLLPNGNWLSMKYWIKSEENEGIKMPIWPTSYKVNG